MIILDLKIWFEKFGKNMIWRDLTKNKILQFSGLKSYLKHSFSFKNVNLILFLTKFTEMIGLKTKFN